MKNIFFMFTLCLPLFCLADPGFSESIQNQRDLFKQIRKNGCEEVVEQAKDELLKMKQTLQGENDVDALQGVNDLFNLRGELKSIVDLKKSICLKKLREYYYLSRGLQDQIYVSAHSINQKNIKDMDFTKISVPNLTDPQRSLLNKKFDTYEVRAGDIMIAKGVSFTSSTISQMATVPSQLSHIAVFVSHEGQLKSVEAYIGKGLDPYPYEEALKNENARIIILRPKDPKLAEEASTAIVKVYNAEKELGRKIKYDYNLDLKKHDRLTCAEVAVYAFEMGSEGKVTVPEFTSQVFFKDETFIKKLGLKNGPMMLPDDMEFDTRFETVLEWTEVDFLQDSIRKDQIMAYVLEQIRAGKDMIQPSFKSKFLDILWKTRDTAWLWPVSAKILGLAKDFDADVPILTLKTSLDVDSSGHSYLSRLYDEDLNRYGKSKRWMTDIEIAGFIRSKLAN